MFNASRRSQSGCWPVLVGLFNAVWLSTGIERFLSVSSGARAALLVSMRYDTAMILVDIELVLQVPLPSATSCLVNFSHFVY